MCKSSTPPPPPLYTTPPPPRPRARPPLPVTARSPVGSASGRLRCKGRLDGTAATSCAAFNGPCSCWWCCSPSEGARSTGTAAGAAVGCWPAGTDGMVASTSDDPAPGLIRQGQFHAAQRSARDLEAGGVVCKPVSQVRRLVGRDLAASSSIGRKCEWNGLLSWCMQPVGGSRGLGLEFQRLAGPDPCSGCAAAQQLPTVGATTLRVGKHTQALSQ